MLDEKGVLSKLKKLHAKKVLVQVPEGLNPRAKGIAEMLEDNGIGCIVSVEPCFGACDLRDREAKQLGCDALLHIGHSDLGLHTVIPVVYEEYGLDFDPVTPLRKHMKKLRGFGSIGLVTTVQHTGSLAKARDFLAGAGHEVFIGKSRNLRPGQVLGCDFSSAKSIASKVDCFLFIGSGSFHYLGLAAMTEKPVFSLDIESGDMVRVPEGKGKLEIKRRMRIEKARGLKNFAIFVSNKPGQMNIGKANEAKKALLKLGKSACIISADRLTSEKIMGMGIDVLVNTACERIYDDQKALGVVILNPEDVKSL